MTTKYWANGTAGNASTGTWSPVGAPANGDDVVIDSHSYQDLTWDLPAVTLNSFVTTGNASATRSQVITLGGALNITNALSIASAHATNTITVATSTYSISCGAITLGANGRLSQTGTGGNVTCTSYTQSGTGSVLTGKVDAWFAFSISFTKTAGAITDNSLRLRALSDGATISITSGASTSFYQSLDIQGNTTMTNIGGYTGLESGQFSIAIGKVLTVNAASFAINNNALQNMQNLGAIVVTGSAIICASSSSITCSLGAIDKVTILAQAGASGNIIIKMRTPPTLGVVTVNSAHATYTCSLDLNGKSLSASGLITVSTRGIISSSVPGATIKALGGVTVAANGSLDATNIKQIENSGNFDSSAGTFTPGTSTYITSSASCTIKLAAGGTIYNLIAKTSVIILGANMTITKLYAHINPMVKGAYTLTLTDPTKEYTGMRRPIIKPIQKLNIGQTRAQCGWMQDLGALL